MKIRRTAAHLILISWAPSRHFLNGFKPRFPLRTVWSAFCHLWGLGRAKWKMASHANGTVTSITSSLNEARMH